VASRITKVASATIKTETSAADCQKTLRVEPRPNGWGFSLGYPLQGVSNFDRSIFL
jgi:hypothetical protein